MKKRRIWEKKIIYGKKNPLPLRARMIVFLVLCFFFLFPVGVKIIISGRFKKKYKKKASNALFSGQMSNKFRLAFRALIIIFSLSGWAPPPPMTEPTLQQRAHFLVEKMGFWKHEKVVRLCFEKVVVFARTPARPPCINSRKISLWTAEPILKS